MVIRREDTGPRQVWSHRGPGSLHSARALCPTPRALPAMPSHSTLDPRPGVGSLGAHVGPLSSPCDAAALGADQAGRLRPHRYYSSLISPSAFTPYYSGRPPGHGHRRCACAGGSRLTPGGGQVMPRTRGLLGVLGAAPPAICRRESVPRRVWEPLQAPLRPRASPQAPPTPVEELPRARQVIRVPRRPRNGHAGGGDKVPPTVHNPCRALGLRESERGPAGRRGRGVYTPVTLRRSGVTWHCARSLLSGGS